MIIVVFGGSDMAPNVLIELVGKVRLFSGKRMLLLQTERTDFFRDYCVSVRA